MAWSKVTKGKKPIKWWYHKILCEIGWMRRRKSMKMYYKHLNKCCQQGFNLYGQKV